MFYWCQEEHRRLESQRYLFLPTGKSALLAFLGRHERSALSLNADWKVSLTSGSKVRVIFLGRLESQRYFRLEGQVTFLGRLGKPAISSLPLESQRYFRLESQRYFPRPTGKSALLPTGKSALFPTRKSALFPSSSYNLLHLS